MIFRFDIDKEFSYDGLILPQMVLIRAEYEAMSNVDTDYALK